MICKICAKEERIDSFSKPLQSELLRHGMCYSCNKWRKLKKKYEKGKAFMIDGLMYEIGDDADFLGFDGRIFHIKCGNKEIVTDNLWYVGRPPQKWMMPDNAQFIPEHHWVRVGNSEILT